jgi:hypothetical protein
LNLVTPFFEQVVKILLREQKRAKYKQNDRHRPSNQHVRPQPRAKTAADALANKTQL